ncbi:imelysin family protein [Hydrogenimonas sp.]
MTKHLLKAAFIGTIATTALFADGGLDKTKSFLLEHTEKLHNEAVALKKEAKEYYDIIKKCGFDYDKCWKKHRAYLTHDVEAMKKHWIEASNNYEIVEGLVAGIPTLTKYDLILDAGIPASEGDEDVAPFDLKCIDGKVKKRPGNHFHNLLEPAIWGTVDKYVGKKVDLNGDGKITKGEVLPNAKFLLSVANSFEHWTGKLLEDAKQWRPTLKDVFTAELTMIPTMGDYFEDWKNSTLLGKGKAFIAESRLFDIKGISGGLKTAYLAAISPKLAKVDPELDKQIRLAFFDLVSFVDDLYMQEQGGKKFPPEAADAFASKAQDMADRLSALVAKAAKKLDIKPEV